MGPPERRAISHAGHLGRRSAFSYREWRRHTKRQVPIQTRDFSRGRRTLLLNRSQGADARGVRARAGDLPHWRQYRECFWSAGTLTDSGNTRVQFSVVQVGSRKVAKGRGLFISGARTCWPLSVTGSSAIASPRAHVQNCSPESPRESGGRAVASLLATLGGQIYASLPRRKFRRVPAGRVLPPAALASLAQSGMEGCHEDRDSSPRRRSQAIVFEF